MEQPSPAKAIAWTVGIWWLGHLLLIAAHVGLVYFYSVAIDPGRDHAHYAAFAERSGPWLSILVGGPLFFAFGRLLRRKVEPAARRIGLWAWALYSATDAAIVVAASTALTPLFVAQWIVSQGVKWLGIYLGTASRKQ